jgi:hypothetical protein
MPQFRSATSPNRTGYEAFAMGRAHTTGENGEWGETKQRSENQVAFNSVLGPS